MKFKSRIDFLHKIIVWATVLFLLGIVVFIWLDHSENIAVNIWATVICLATVALLVSVYSNTHYEIDSEFFYYQSGPIRGKFPVSQIREIDVNRTLWVGTLKPATALKGLIIKYNKYDEIYISPKTNESFVAEILKLNPEVKINRL